MRQHFAICTNGMQIVFIVKIDGDVKVPLQEKMNYPDWHLSIYPRPYADYQSRKLDCNSMTPFFIYGAELVDMVVDSESNILYSTYADWKPEGKEKFESVRLKIFDYYLKNASEQNCFACNLPPA